MGEQELRQLAIKVGDLVGLHADDSVYAFTAMVERGSAMHADNLGLDVARIRRLQGRISGVTPPPLAKLMSLDLLPSEIEDLARHQEAFAPAAIHVAKKTVKAGER